MSGSESAIAGTHPGAHVLARMLAEGRLDRFEGETVQQQAARARDRIEEAILDCGLMTEAELLKYLASIYGTQFVSTLKLSKAQVAAEALEMLPVKLAERLDAFPVLYDRKAQTISIVAADLHSVDVAKQVQLVTGARQVKVYVARARAIRAAIQKHYYRRPNAFAGLVDVASRPAPSASFDDGAEGAPAADPRHASIVTDEAGMPSIEVSFTTSDLLASLSAATRKAAAEVDALAEDARRVPAEPVAPETYLETLNVLVALLEHGRGELRGHSAKVARLCRKLCERIGLAEAQMQGTLIAAYLHDVGKASGYHLTALNVAHYEAHRAHATKAHLAPVRLFDAARLPNAAVKVVTHLYERWDGNGFPDHLAGKDIPLGARILAVVETFVDLTSSAKNPFRQLLSPKQACDAVARFRGQLFDPTVVDLLKLVVLGDDLKEKLLEDRRIVLLVEPDPEETTVLEMRLIEHGYDVVIARDAAAGLRRIAEDEIDIVVAEVELSGEVDGFELLGRIRSGSKPRLPLMFLTRRGDRESVTRGLELGAADYVVKPASAEVVVAKARHILDGATGPKAGRGVTGSLREMALPDVIQILSNGRKSGRLRIDAGGTAGEIHFGDGAIFDARFGAMSGDEAFYSMLLLSDGDFLLDPSFRPTQNVIKLSTESLLLEGMRRYDERDHRST
ncbi:MAG: DUF4388 domain-containing protein [Polyangiaceae bacterium]|nr:DUF4388 domain-containing protein [Polyangiaceae bacterium]